MLFTKPSQLNLYINDFKNITNHRDALKHFQVRYSSFNQNYPKDCTLPTCVLAEYGFYFDEKNKSIKCFECDFKYDDFNQDSFLAILHKHSKFRPSCTQVIAAQEYIVYDQTKQNEVDSMEIDEDNGNKSNQQSSKSSRSKHNYHIEEARFATFENVKMQLSAKMLSENGFYMVSKDSTANVSLSMSKSKSTITIAAADEPNQIEKIAGLVPALIYIKCAYCPYECLIFKNSLLNTMFKSPTEEHWEKSNKLCPIFLESKINKSPVKVTENGIDQQSIYTWLQCLLDFDAASSEGTGRKTVADILSFQGQKNLDDVVVKQIPKVIDQLVINEKSKMNALNSLPSTKDQKGDNVVYMPKALMSGAGHTTSDFSKLQNVLNNSDNVISEKAIHPAYTLYQTRVDSFKEWPATLSQQPPDLAKAGFYYFGIKDMVKCFFCNGGLKNWDHNDDPFEDHVRWFPKCQFIRQLMGAEFVEHIKDKYKNQDSGFTADNSQTNDSSNSNLSKNLNYGLSNRNQNKTKRSVSPRTLNSRLDTIIVRRMLDTIQPITKESIKQSIEIQLSAATKIASPVEKKNTSIIVANTYGDDFKSPIDMAKLAIELERNKAEKTETFKSISDFIISYIDPVITVENIQNLILVKYGIFPNNVRILREQGFTESNRCFALVSLNKKDESICDEIIKDLDLNHFLLNKNERTITFKTVWNEFEEKIKPLLTKPIAVSTNELTTEIETVMNPSSGGIKSNDNIEKEAIISRENIKKELKEVATDESMNDDKSILMEENERLKSERLCVICLNKDKNVLFLPCAHLAACLDCSFNLQNCPICRSKIQATVRTYS